MSGAGLRVLVVDDSAVVRRALRERLAARPGIAAVETAADGEVALKKVGLFDPEAVTPDVEMPGCGGLSTLERLMAESPRLVIMLSAMRSQGVATAAQDEATSAVFGMPRAAIDAGAAQRVVGLDQVPRLLRRWAGDPGTRLATHPASN